jgi:uncharacterized protein involved in exopolysaccharide biosynthesis
LTFSDIAAFFLRNWKTVFGLAVVAGILVALPTILFVPRQYEASATLVIVPPKFASDLKPSTLTVQGYQQLLESDAVIAEAKKRLVASGVLEDKDHLKLGQNIETKIFASRRAEEMVLAPMLQAVARGRSAQQAAAIANAWASVFVERTRAMMAGPTSATVQLVEKQYPEARDAVGKLEEERRQVQDEMQKRYDNAKYAWDSKIAAYENETSDLLAAFNSETKRIVTAFAGDKNLDTRKIRLEAMRKSYGDLQEEQARVNAQYEQRKLEVDALRKQLLAVPQYLELHKAITDDALWQSLKKEGGQGTDWNSLQKRSLVSQELNPVYKELSLKLSQDEAALYALVPRAEQLKAEIERLSGEIKPIQQSYDVDTAALEKLTEERNAGQQKLQEDRTLGVSQLADDKQRELDGISREREARLAELNRDINHETELYTEVAKAYNQGVLAKAQQDVEDVRIGSPAVPPDSARPRGTALKALLAAIIGGMLGLLIAVVRESQVQAAR